MKNFNLRKYLADNRLLKEATIKVGDKVDVKPGVIDDFSSDQYVYNVNVEKINGDKLTVKDANDDEYEVSISDVEELNENKLLKESNRDLYDKVIGNHFEKEDEGMSLDFERNAVKKVIRQAMEDMDSNQTLLTRDYIDTIIDRLNDLKMSDF